MLLEEDSEHRGPMMQTEGMLSCCYHAAVDYFPQHVLKCFIIHGVFYPLIISINVAECPHNIVVLVVISCIIKSCKHFFLHQPDLFYPLKLIRPFVLNDFAIYGNIKFLISL